MSEVKKHGIIEQLPNNDWLDEHVCELNINGFTTIPSGLSQDFIQKAKDRLDEVYKEQVKEFGGEQELDKLSDRNIARGLLAYDKIFLDAIWSENVQKFCKKVFAHGHWIISQNGLLNPPKNDFYQQAWHRDLNFQHFVSTKATAITTMLCLDNFTFENGATFVLPSSHKINEFPTDRFVKKHEQQIVAPAGSFIIFDSLLFHRAGQNVSDFVRRGVVTVIGQPYVCPSINIPSLFKSKGLDKPEDKDLQSFLGYRWSPAEDVTDWRKKRIK